ncbi:S-adenosylmethionine uptake transporter [Aliiroseovarius sediminilitoris]|uniref:S-adenosylmethionine uptake transporter n=1 Tax=Aliiroseovarius sediminilitoris TaxID=1173584 RepID=A0A1I0N684_9RHOB|nr:DMT family transporter [Aliiroseovarius sediminilitoris]SEV96301.1 S-adenosylmethionine uptake transporter [Aliiroseovarius sediminilitoris]
MPVSDNMKGAALMAGAMAGYTFNDASMKALSGDMPLSQAVFLRGIVTSLMLLGLGLALRSLTFRLSRREWKLMLLRSLAEMGATYCFLSALFNMPIANVTAVLQALPLTVALAAWAFLGEPLGWRRLFAILVGFVGVVLIVKPGGDGFTAWSVYALLAVGFITLRDLVVRKMSPTTPSMTVALVASVAITVAFGMVSATVEWSPITVRSGGFLVLAASFIFMGYLFSVMVMRVGDIGFIAPFRYTGLIWALIIGLIFFGEWPEVLTLIGAGIVVATGLFTLFRERQQSRQARAKGFLRHP